MPEGLEHGRHAAFVCCSEKDRKGAARLCRRLGAFPIARELVGRETPMGVVPARLGPLFLPPVAADAGTTIPAVTRQALEGADTLLLLASPDSASSLRVNEEVRLFRHLYPGRPVIPLILASATAPTGRPLFPPALRFQLNADGRVSQVPGPTLVAADERGNGDGPELAHAKVVARLLGVETETVHATHRARRRRARVLALAAAVVLALGLSGGYAGLLVWREARLHAEVARQQAETARRAAHLKTVLECLRPSSPPGIAGGGIGGGGTLRR